MKTSSFRWFSFAIVFLLIGCGSQEHEPLKGPEIVRDGIHGFSMTLPAGWESNSPSPSPEETTLARYQLPNSQGVPIATLAVEAEASKSSNPFLSEKWTRGFLDSLKTDPEMLRMSVDKFSPIAFQQTQGYAVVATLFYKNVGAPLKFRFLFLKKNGYIFIFLYSSPDPFFEAHQADFYQAMDSVIFTSPQTTGAAP